MDWLIGHGSQANAAALLLGFLGVTLWEWRHPLSLVREADPHRPLANFGLLLLWQALQYVLVPASAALAAWVAGGLGAGLLVPLGLPLALEVVVALVLLDALSWAYHWALHHQAWLWRVHQVHHNDLDYDASLAFRFHPIEPILHALLAAAVVAALGLSVAAVLLAGLIGQVHNVFVHANATLPSWLERHLNRFIVTPDWHRVHHSAVVAESMSNLAIVFTWWDRLAGTALAPRPVPRLGMDEWRDRGELGLLNLLKLPLQRSKG